MANATKRPRPRTSASRGKSGGSSLFTGLLVGLIIGITAAIGVAYYINHSESPFKGKAQKDSPVSSVSVASAPKSSPKAPEVLRPTVNKDEVVPKISEAKDNSSTPVSLDFYTMLPGLNEKNSKATKPTKVPSKPEDKPLEKVTQDKGAYLQAGAFKDEYDADNLKAKLALLGVEARIKTENVPEKGIWHRVRIGPFTSTNELEKIRAQLHANGVESVIIKSN